VFNATFSNISAISWRPVLVVEEARVTRENHRLWASNWYFVLDITPPSFMKFCPVVPEICHGQVHGPWKERRRKRRIIIIKIKII
jgi:hypothetical protein